MTEKLKNHFVAFIDLLGFSSMVKHDCENPESAHKYIDKLKDIHSKTRELQKEIEGLQLIQFSDSVVLALPFNKDHFEAFSKLVSDYQFSLLENGILCRGGVSYGIHHFDKDFLFSNGLIHAYNIEKDIAIHPRIVVSEDLINLIYQSHEDIPDQLFSKENDGAFFINFLKNRNPATSEQAIRSTIPSRLSPTSSIRGKQIWMLEYYNHCFPESPFQKIPRFG